MSQDPSARRRPSRPVRVVLLVLLVVAVLVVLFTLVFPWIERNLSNPTLRASVPVAVAPQA